MARAAEEPLRVRDVTGELNRDHPLAFSGARLAAVIMCVAR